MNNLRKTTITTLEIAEMMETEHWKLLRKLEGRTKNGKHERGYIDILGDNQMDVTDFFIKSSYRTEQNKERPCYEVTKLGCDFLANKFTGEKGVYDKMENKKTIKETRILTEKEWYLDKISEIITEMKTVDALKKVYTVVKTLKDLSK